MAAIFAPSRNVLSLQCQTLIARSAPSAFKRALSTLPNNPDIYIHEQPDASPRSYLLSYLPNTPPVPSLAIGSTSKIPPTPDSLTENPEFSKILHWVVKDNAVHDPQIQAQASVYASQAGSSLGSGGVLFPQQRQQQALQRRQRKAGTATTGGGGGTGGDGAGGASAQGGSGGAGRGGFIHVSDQRNPPDWGRVAWPEDILGSLEVDGDGNFVEPKGRYSQAGTYRFQTNEGLLGLSPYLKGKLVEQLKALDQQARSRGG